MGRGNYIPSTPFTYYFYVHPDIEYEDDYDYAEEWRDAGDDLQEILYDLAERDGSQWVRRAAGDGELFVEDRLYRWRINVIRDETYYVIEITPDINELEVQQPSNIYERSAYWSETLAEFEAAAKQVMNWIHDNSNGYHQIYVRTSAWTSARVLVFDVDIPQTEG